MKLLHILERQLKRSGRLLFAIGSFLYYFRVGKENNYPTCCILHFAFDASRRKPPALRRGSIRIDAQKLYVPCALHKGRHPNWKSYFDRDPNQLRLFKETPLEAQDRRRRQRELERRYSGRRFGRPYRQGH